MLPPRSGWTAGSSPTCPLTFVVSTAWSGVSVLGGALVWYFAALIGIAVLLALLALTRPRWMPSVFLKPLMDLHPFVVPSVAVAVTCVPLLLGKGEYALIMFLCGAYFALMAARSAEPVPRRPVLRRAGEPHRGGRGRNLGCQ